MQGLLLLCLIKADKVSEEMPTTVLSTIPDIPLLCLLDFLNCVNRRGISFKNIS